MAKVIELDSSKFENEVLKSARPVLVDFWAPWCQPCLMMAPILEELVEDKEIEGKVKITKLNVEDKENQALAAEYQILSIPNMKIFKDGEIIKEIIGLRSKEDLKRELLEAIK